MKDSFVEINIIPLVDIMLVLIVIVLITANFAARGMIPVNLPKADVEQNRTSEMLVVKMTLGGEIYLENKAMTLEELAVSLVTLDTERPVLVSADRDLTLQPFISLVELLRHNGFTRISIQTER